jgi:hypothetical protein
VLSTPDVSRQFSKNFVSVHVDFSELPATDPRHDTVERYNTSQLHPVLIFLDASGKQVARIVGGLKSKEDALLLDRYIAGRHYRQGDYKSFRAAPPP